MDRYWIGRTICVASWPGVQSEQPPNTEDVCVYEDVCEDVCVCSWPDVQSELPPNTEDVSWEN